MNDAAPPARMPPTLRTAAFWARFHAMRSLQRPATVLWIGALVVVAAGLRIAGDPRDVVTFLVTLALPLLALFFGSGGLREEVEDQTLTYAFVRPLDRGAIFLARTAAAAVVVMIPIVIGLLVALSSPLELPRQLAVALLGVLAYVPLFAMLGLVLQHPMLVGLAVLAWDQILGAVPGFLSLLTVRTHLRGLLDLPSAGGMLGAMVRPPSAWVSVPVLLGVAMVCCTVGVMWVRKRELVVPK
jgi:hypothetical protein